MAPTAELLLPVSFLAPSPHCSAPPPTAAPWIPRRIAPLCSAPTSLSHSQPHLTLSLTFQNGVGRMQTAGKERARRSGDLIPDGVEKEGRRVSSTTDAVTEHRHTVGVAARH
ncbi:hypothetical protein ABZP36_006624 [Zizania latifolia]